jgi:hypothetical protein
MRWNAVCLRVCDVAESKLPLRHLFATLSKRSAYVKQDIRAVQQHILVPDYIWAPESKWYAVIPFIGLTDILGSVDVKGDTILLGTIQSPQQIVLSTIMKAVQQRLTARRTLLRKHLESKYLSRILNGEFGPFIGLLADIGYLTSFFDTDNDSGASRLTNTILNETFHGDGEYSIQGELPDVDMYMPTIRLAFVCVSTSRLH